MHSGWAMYVLHAVGVPVHGEVHVQPEVRQRVSPVMLAQAFGEPVHPVTPPTQLHPAMALHAIAVFPLSQADGEPLHCDES
jgi:hypothetical protein